MSDDAVRPVEETAPPDPNARPRDLDAQVRRLRRWLLGLVVLLAFLVGGLGGAAAFWWQRARQPGPALGLARAIQVVADPSDRRAFRNALAEGRRVARLQVRDVQDARAALARLLTDPSASTAALEDALARLRQAEGALRASLEPRVAGVLAGVPLDRRRAIADAILPQGRRGQALEE